jgi:3-deoxy-7-phosphoheptulonate synthase
MNKKVWHPEQSWQQQKNISQQPAYPDMTKLEHVVHTLKNELPLVGVPEIQHLIDLIAQAQKGDAFLFQAGDCAENFEEATETALHPKLRLLKDLHARLAGHGMRKIFCVGRLAGQYAKPRTEDQETQNGLTLPVYRGDLINDIAFTETGRRPDPERMLKGYHAAARTLAIMNTWSDSSQSKPSDRIFTSHEALLLPYEAALTHYDTTHQTYFNLGTHFPWVGLRTTHLNSPHLEYIKGIANPVALKIGPSMTAEHLLNIIEQINPDNTWGRLTLIHRMGNTQINACLPPLIDAVKGAQARVLWCCDPMHGNTVYTATQIKTRQIESIINELTAAIDIHKKTETILGGLHLELTPESVTECIGGQMQLTETDLKKAYKTRVDPRLNAAQSVEVLDAFCLQYQR